MLISFRSEMANEKLIVCFVSAYEVVMLIGGALLGHLSRWKRITMVICHMMSLHSIFTLVPTYGHHKYLQEQFNVRCRL